MSAIEFGSPSPALSYTLPVMVAGTTTSALLPSYFLASSKITGIKRTTSGGVPGSPFVFSITPSAIGTLGCTLVVRSSSATDTSVYTISWTNDVANGSLPC